MAVIQPGSTSPGSVKATVIIDSDTHTYKMVRPKDPNTYNQEMAAKADPTKLSAPSPLYHCAHAQKPHSRGANQRAPQNRFGAGHHAPRAGNHAAELRDFNFSRDLIIPPAPAVPSSASPRTHDCGSNVIFCRRGRVAQRAALAVELVKNVIAICANPIAVEASDCQGTSIRKGEKSCRIINYKAQVLFAPRRRFPGRRTNDDDLHR